MKKIFVSLLLFAFLCQDSSAQTKPIRPKSFGFSFIGNDFVTAQQIRNTSLTSVIRNKKLGKFKDMNHGFAFTYAKGVTPTIDFATTLGISFGNFTLPKRSFSNGGALVELDASGNFKLFTEEATVNPYLIAGVGASLYKNFYGAFIPLGGGIKVNIMDQTQIHVQLQYRVPVTTEANNYHFQLGFGISGVL